MCECVRVCSRGSYVNGVITDACICRAYMCVGVNMSCVCVCVCERERVCVA